MRNICQRNPDTAIMSKKFSITMSINERFQQANQLLQQQQYAPALQVLSTLIADYSNQPDILNLQAKALLEINQIDAAYSVLKAALLLAPNHALSHFLMGRCLEKMPTLQEKPLAHYAQAVQIEPKNANYRFQWLLTRQSQAFSLSEIFNVLREYDRFLRDFPTHHNGFHQRSDLLKHMGLYQLALMDAERAIALKPDFALAWCNKSFLLNILGRYQEGWAAYEWRFRTDVPTFHTMNLPIPQWQGEQIGQCRLLVYAEQGLGDNLQFVRLAIAAKQRGLNVVVVNHQPLENLLAENLQRYGVETSPNGASIPNLHYHISMMSLPHYLGITLDNIPFAEGYIRPEKDFLAKWQQKLTACSSSKLKIGVVWAGSNAHDRNRQRSIQFADFAKLFLLNAEFHCLQKEIAESDRYTAAQFSNVHLWSEQLNDFSDTSALLAQMDLVISVDTSVAHLGGAMGKPTWIMLTYHPDFRWLADRADSPWYRSVRLFRQAADFDWKNVIDIIYRTLQQEYHLNETKN